MLSESAEPPRRSAPALVCRRAVVGGLGALALAPVTAAPEPRTRFGVNCYDLFLDGFKSGGRFGTATLEALGRQGIPFVRFPASAMWAGDWDAYERDPRAYWAGMDSLFAAAEQSGVRLVPSVLWHLSALAFHAGEPMQAWAAPQSRTRVLAARYTVEMVERYDSSRALLMWEFGNEPNDWIDLPNVLQFWPKSDPTMPRRGRSELDKLTYGDLTKAVAGFSAVVRRHGRKPIGMGSNFPRQNAWHLARGSSDTDTPDQFATQFRALTPPLCDVLSVHVYPEVYGKPNTVFPTLDALLAGVVSTAAADGRIPFVGEFGVPRMLVRPAEYRIFAEMVATLERSGVRYAAIWNYGNGTRPPDQWTVTATNDRAYQLDAIVAANQH